MNDDLQDRGLQNSASVSICDVAVRAGMSVGTVSNVLNRPDKVSLDACSRVHAGIAELGFVRNDAARQLRMGHSSSIGLIVLDVANPFFTDIARGAVDRAAKSHLSVLLAISAEDTTRENAFLDLFESQPVRGVRISPRSSETARLTAMRRLGIPAVIVDRHLDDQSFSSVSVDDFAGGHMAVARLRSLGYRRITFVGAQRAFAR